MAEKSIHEKAADKTQESEILAIRAKKKHKVKGFLRHRFVYKTLRLLLARWLARKFNYRYEIVQDAKRPYIVLSNHTTDFDPLLVGLSFPDMMYFVASEHIFRWAAGKIINYLVAPIPRIKATKEVQTAKEVMHRLKAGANICIFAEGNRCFDGETGYISESTGKLIKLCGVTLYTYRLTGGYFTSPRWSKTLRIGEMSGGIVKEYTPEMLKSMKVNEINAAICNDLYVNAYDDQKTKPVEYKGERLAEQMETALYICPHCDAIGTLTSKDDRLTCSCGLQLRFTTMGYFESVNGDKPPFTTILEWSKWQQTRILEKARAYIASQTQRPITSDHGQTISQVKRILRSRNIGTGTLEMYHDRLVLNSQDREPIVFEFRNISDIAIHGQMVLILSTTDRSSFEFHSDHPRSALKYLELYRAFSKIKSEEEEE